MLGMTADAKISVDSVFIQANMLQLMEILSVMVNICIGTPVLVHLHAFIIKMACCTSNEQIHLNFHIEVSQNRVVVEYMLWLVESLCLVA